MASFEDFKAAIDFRDLIYGIVEAQVKTFHPEPRYGMINSIDYANGKCTLIYVGEATPVTVQMGSVVRPFQAGQVVRVEGIGQDRYIADIITGPTYEPKEPASTAYTPSLTAGVTNPTLSTGSSKLGQYTIIGNRCFYDGEIKLGTSGFAAGSGQYLISLPVAPRVLPWSNQLLGSLGASPSGGSWFDCIPFLSSGSSMYFWGPTTATGPAESGVTHTGVGGTAWANTGIIRWSLNYEIVPV